MDKILLNRMQFYGYHGVFPEENKLGQRFYVDLELYASLQNAGMSDCIDESIDYGHVFAVVKEIVEGEAKSLLEAVAEEIAKNLFDTFQMLDACLVRVIKPDPPIDGQYQSVAVEIFRERSS